jgi:hypothetical protein
VFELINKALEYQLCYSNQEKLLYSRCVYCSEITSKKYSIKKFKELYSKAAYVFLCKNCKQYNKVELKTYT